MVLAFRLEVQVQANNPLADFKPGNIMSDFVMSNYRSMSEIEIQTFLKSKNSCNDTNIAKAKLYPHLKYNIKDGHFVCMAEESFDGESAAHIIWQAAQDFKINPQVLIVLLEKEQSLVSDTWPNHIQYRSATGYGCPDSTPGVCSAKFYGFKNQVRWAAKLFREVLDGGWTNYPLGNNYVQYNPNKACGGSIVNIENLATSALYRYTPYQPNAAAIAAGYGTTHCGAYGNRNFYLFFKKWFGNTTNIYEPLVVQRFLRTKTSTQRINIYTEQPVGDKIPAGTDIRFTSKTIKNNKLYLRSEFDTNANLNYVIPIDLVEEISFQPLQTPIYLETKTNLSKINILNLKPVANSNIETGSVFRFVEKITIQGKDYYKTSDDIVSNANFVLPQAQLVKPSFKPFNIPRFLESTTKTKTFDPIDEGASLETIATGAQFMFDSKIKVNGQAYFRTSTQQGKRLIFKASDLKELDFENLAKETWLMLKANSKSYQVPTGQADKKVHIAINQPLPFSRKIFMGNKLYYQTTNDYKKSNGVVYSADDLTNIKFNEMEEPRMIKVAQDSYVTDMKHLTNTGNKIPAGTIKTFNQKTIVAGKLFLRSEKDSKNDSLLAMDYKVLKELPEVHKMTKPRFLMVAKDVSKFDFYNNKLGENIKKNAVFLFTKRVLIGEKLFLITENDAKTNQPLAIEYSQLLETPAQFELMTHPRRLHLKTASFKTNVFNNTQDNHRLEKNQTILFDAKIIINNRLFLRSSNDSLANLPLALSYEQLAEML